MRIENEEQKLMRIAEKQEMTRKEEKRGKKKERAEKEKKEAEEHAERERKEAEKRKRRKEEEGRLRVKKEAEERRRKEKEEEEARRVKAKQLRKEEAAEQERGIAEMATAGPEQQAAVPATAVEAEKGEIEEKVKEEEKKESSPAVDAEQAAKTMASDKEILRIDAAVTAPEPVKRRPGPLNLSNVMSSPVPAARPSDLATARTTEDLDRVPYPEGIKSPSVELNVNAQKGKFR